MLTPQYMNFITKVYIKYYSGNGIVDITVKCHRERSTLVHTSSAAPNTQVKRNEHAFISDADLSAAACGGVVGWQW